MVIFILLSVIMHTLILVQRSGKTSCHVSHMWKHVFKNALKAEHGKGKGRQNPVDRKFR